MAEKDTGQGSVPGQQPRNVLSELIFLGTGVSTGVPRLSCVLQKKTRNCEVCTKAQADPMDPNFRGNVSVLLRSRTTTIMIDAGKTMRDTVLRWFPRHDVSGIDALLLTHGHADAIGGIDDLRDLQPILPQIGEGGEIVDFLRPKELPIFLNKATFEVCKGAYPYLIPELNNDDTPRRIALLKWNVIEDNRPFEIEGTEVWPLPVLHGGSYICLGFAFGGGALVYLSDLSRIPGQVMDQLLTFNIKTLVLDALAHRGCPSHLSLSESIDIVRTLKPKQTFLVGMSCEMGLHEDVNKELRNLVSEGLNVQLARDGLSVPLI